MKDITRKTIRLKNRDYSSEGIYFITICTQARQYLFGYKENKEIKLSQIGFVVKDSLEKLHSRYEGITLDDYAIMPNHIHCIIVYSGINSSNLVSLPVLLGNIKSFTTHEYLKDKTRITPVLWERGYFEHVIRYCEMDFIRNYIQNNPVDWENEDFFNLQREYLESIHQ